MNLITVLILATLALMLTWVSSRCRREAKEASTPQEAKMWQYSSRILLVIAIVLASAIIASQVDIPNPFAPTSSKEELPAPGLNRTFDDKSFTVPATNANPKTAAENNRKLLEEVRRQQQDSNK